MLDLFNSLVLLGVNVSIAIIGYIMFKSFVYRLLGGN